MKNVKFVYSEKMQWENSYTDRAYRKLELLCKTKFHNRYSTGWDSMDACQQMKKELSYVKQQGSAPLIIETYETLTAIEASHKDFFLKGPIGTSVILYVMGISDIEPLSVRPKVYPEFYFGIDGEKKLTIDIFVMPKLYEKLIWYFQNYIGEARLRYKLALGNGKFFGVRISDPQRNIDIENDAMEFNFVITTIPKPKSFAKNITIGQPFEEIKPKTFAEQVKCKCWNSTGYGTWAGNGQDLYRTGGAKLEDIISNREDVYEYLIAHGIDRRVAFGIVEDIALGQMSYGGWDKETLEILDRAGIPEWYIQSCQKIIGLTSRMHAITMLKHFGKEIRSEKQ